VVVSKTRELALAGAERANWSAMAKRRRRSQRELELRLQLAERWVAVARQAVLLVLAVIVLLVTLGVLLGLLHGVHLDLPPLLSGG
jgi:hypothetical protein